MKIWQSLLSLSGAVLFAVGATPAMLAAELQQATLLAWKAYMGEVDVRMEQRAASKDGFLWTDESRERAARVRRGEVVVAPVLGHGTENVPDGLIHHWIGAVFVPGGSLEDLSAVMHDYDNYKRLYRPAVAASRTLACTQSRQEFQMTWQRHVLLVNAAMQGHYQAHEVRVDSRRGYSVVDTMEVRQIEGYGCANQHFLPPDTGSGFIWRIRSVSRYEQRDGGVILELEAIALTRDIPASLSWLVAPLVNHLSINSLTTTLRQTRNAVIEVHGSGGRLASCLIAAGAVTMAKARGEK
jgi:hypothetical protein